MDCAGKGTGKGRCAGPAKRRCHRCGAVAYCSLSHQLSHWSDHKDECARLKEQMKQASVLSDFPFTYCVEATHEILEKRGTRCSFLTKRGVHKLGMWACECRCWQLVDSLGWSRFYGSWDLPSEFCPCKGPVTGFSVSKHLSSWDDYCKWRHIPLHSPVALLLQWPLLIYRAVELTGLRHFSSEISKQLYIHYLGPEKELLQIAAFGELRALFPDVQVHIELIGPAVPQLRDGETIELCKYGECTENACKCKSLDEDAGQCSPVVIHFRRGYYHDIYQNSRKEPSPHLVVAPNAGIAAYSSWLPTIELINEMNVPAIFSDYCEEACHIGSRCISSVTGRSLTIPIQLNPFRQPMVVEDATLLLPCYSNCFLFGL